MTETEQIEISLEAYKLAYRPYSIYIEHEVLEDGPDNYLARHPELPGCKAEGVTVEEARWALDEARLDYIQALLEWGSEVSPPKHPNRRVVTIIASYIGRGFSTTTIER